MLIWFHLPNLFADNIRRICISTIYVVRHWLQRILIADFFLLNLYSYFHGFYNTIASWMIKINIQVLNTEWFGGIACQKKCPVQYLHKSCSLLLLCSLMNSRYIASEWPANRRIIWAVFPPDSCIFNELCWTKAEKYWTTHI